MTDRELMQQALEGLEAAYEGQIWLSHLPDLSTALRERLAQPEREFIAHEEGEGGWSEWVCPDPKSYLMKCCDCGLVHEAQFGVVRYKSETEREDCDMVDDPNLQAVFRMRRSEQWTPKDTAYRPGGLAQSEREWVGLTDEVIWLEYQRFWPFHPAEEPTLAKDIVKFARAVEAKLKDKNNG